MKKMLLQRKLIFFGFVLLLVVNGVVLGSVLANRSGAPDAQIVLSERELVLPHRTNKENSGLSLRLDWRVEGEAKGTNFYSNWHSPVWFDVTKLQELGVEVVAESSDNHRRRSSRDKEVFIILDIDSPAFAKVVAALESDLAEKQRKLQLDVENKELRKQAIRATERLQEEKLSGSRLFAIDAGLDADQLRQQYSDRNKYVLTKGIINYRWNYSGKNNKQKEVRGYIARLSNGNIHVPLKHRLKLETILGSDVASNSGESGAIFQVELAYGGRLEPWVVSIENRKAQLLN